MSKLSVGQKIASNAAGGKDVIISTRNFYNSNAITPKGCIYCNYTHK